MASFIGCVDFKSTGENRPPPAALAELEVFEALESGRACMGPCSMDWRAARSAPVSQARSSEGAWCLVLGYIEPDDEGIVNAADYVLEEAEKDPTSISTHGGYYFAIVLRADGSVCLGGDYLGFFPIFYWHDDERFHFATSPALMRHLPGYEPALDPQGVISLLLFGFGSRGHTLWRGVRRLGAGEVAIVEVSKEPRIVESASHYPEEDVLEGISEDQILERAMEALSPVFPQEGAQSVAALLSGGLDSRTIAGLSQRAGFNVVAAVSLGQAGDIEIECARRVARKLGLPMVPVPAHPDRNLELAKRLVVAEGFANDFFHFDFPQAVPALRELGVPIVTGFFGGPVLGGIVFDWARDKETGELSFDSFLGTYQEYGFPPEVVRRLLRPAFRGEGVESEMAAIRAVYEGYPGTEGQRLLRFEMAHRQRTNIAPCAWKLSFGAWPVSPFAQKRVLRLANQLPLRAFDGRRLQRDLLARNFPELARLPLDGGVFNTQPIDPGLIDRLKADLVARRRRRRKRRTGRDSRYYCRIFDFDGEAFRDIRHHVAPLLGVLDDVFDPDELRRLLPAPDEKRSYENPIHSHAGFKSILGLAMLMEQTGLSVST
ncbi:MAG: hypothetical protein JRG92_23600 [Deltaproteobacteria bacterium]|nr:hypothetical protein [Deltaproteobacteria bacterium]MBW2386626.1 hypothetical protein [Deltaproteobacteria bacterium]MBW2698282.1 hypothetical protein [Deltaproteobacteria bacterium]